MKSTFYVLDPSGDLKNCRKTFEDWFESIPSWKRLRPETHLSPSDAISNEILQELKAKDVFLYVGHGCGESFFHPKQLRHHLIRSVSLLMGCSSGKLKTQGEGSIIEYSAAGSPCCIGNLWAVSDMDSNRFSKRLIEIWMNPNQTSIFICFASRTLYFS